MSIFSSLQNRPSIRQHASRFAEIVGTFAKFGLAGYLPDGAPEALKNHLKGPEGEDLKGLELPERVRMALAELGATWVKLGQTLSTRPDLVGAEMGAELEKLQSGTPADDPDAVRQIVESELGRTIEDAFATFDLQALASASIGQVHVATTKEGESVVVKVQHAGVEEDVSTDLAILTTMAEFAEKHGEEVRRIQPARMVREFERSLTRELDFGREADHLAQFAENFDGDETVHFPKLYTDLSTRRVLTMERLDGTSVKHPDAIRERGIEPRDVAQRGADAWIKMILEDGYFHADPHPGNMLVLEDGRLGILDCGMIGRVDGGLLRSFESLVLALIEKDADELAEVVLDMVDAPSDLDRDAFRSEMTDWCGDYLRGSLERLDAQAATNDAMALFRRFHLVMPSGIAQLIRTLALLEGTSRGLDRSFSVFALLEPYAKKIVLRRLSPKHVAKETLKRARSWDRLMESAPDDLRDILERLRRGTFRVHLEHRRLDTTVNRLVYGVLLAALFLGSAWMLSAGVPPRLWGASLFGLLGLVGSIAGAWGLLRGMRRSGWLSREER